MTVLTRALLILCVCGVVVFVGIEAAKGDTSDSTAVMADSQSRDVLSGWALGGAYSIVALGSDGPIQETLRGPSFCIGRLNSHGIGFDVAFTAIVENGYWSFSGLSAHTPFFSPIRELVLPVMNLPPRLLQRPC